MRRCYSITSRPVSISRNLLSDPSTLLYLAFLSEPGAVATGANTQVECRDTKGIKQTERVRSSQLWMILLCAGIFLAALGVRILHRQDNSPPPFYGMTGEYKAHALTLVDGNYKVFLGGPNPPSDANVVKHPPGYPLLIALVYKFSGNSDYALQRLQIVFDAVAAVLVFLIAIEMFSVAVATLAGFLVALSPQLAYHSIALLPDPLAAPPLLLAAYFLVRAYKHPRIGTMLAAGALVGVSCWFRSNAILLPFFIAALTPILFKSGIRLRMAVALVAASLLVIAPITIRNWIFFRSFMPVSLSAGITLVEGIGVYDKDHRFGLPSTDYGVTKWEVEEFGRPDYLGTRFNPDGVIRERYRIRRGLAVVRAHPFWFLGVMAHRAGSMWRLARVELIRPQPAVTHSPSVAPGTPASATIAPIELETVNRFAAKGTQITLTGDGSALRAESPAATVLLSGSFAVMPHTDYLLRIPLKIERGSIIVDVMDADRNTLLASTPILHPINWLDLKPEQQPAIKVDTPFVSNEANKARFVIRNGARGVAPTVVGIGTVEVFPLGESRQTTTRYVRIPLHLAQKLFITAIVLPFTLLGAIWLGLRRRWRELAVLLIVPVYYMCVQSALWTEFRYILTMHYFVLILAAVGFVWMVKTAASMISKLFAARHSVKKQS